MRRGGPCCSGHSSWPDALGPYGSGPANHRHLQTSAKGHVAAVPLLLPSWETRTTRKTSSETNSPAWGSHLPSEKLTTATKE